MAPSSPDVRTTMHPPAALPPAGHLPLYVAGGRMRSNEPNEHINERTNELTNELTNKHDWSQYLLAGYRHNDGSRFLSTSPRVRCTHRKKEN